MKYCPTCQTKYDYEMSFCLQDGTPLQIENSPLESANSSEKTLVLPPTSVPPQSSVETENFAEQTFALPETAMSQPTIAPTEYVINQPNDWSNTQTNPPSNNLSSPNNAVFTAPQIENAPRRKSGFGLLIGIVAAGLLLIATAIGGIFVFFQFPPKDVALANANSNINKPNPLQTNSVDSNTNANTSQVFTGNSIQENRIITNSAEKPTPKTTASVENSSKPTPSVTTKPSIEDGTPIPMPTRTPTPKPTVENTPPPAAPKTISGGVLNGKAVSLVRPPYPPAARAVHASGVVQVQVLIDENGNVISASAVSGHPLLKQSAEQAARASKFSPTLLSGQRVKVSGVIVYNFSAQ